LYKRASNISFSEQTRNHMSQIDDFLDSRPAAAHSSSVIDDFLKDAPERAPQRTALGTLSGVGVTALKGAVGLPQGFVGLADIPTGGRVGKFLEDTAGYRPQETQEYPTSRS
jgi:hypothetical protein